MRRKKRRQKKTEKQREEIPQINEKTFQIIKNLSFQPKCPIQYIGLYYKKHAFKFLREITPNFELQIQLNDM